MTNGTVLHIAARHGHIVLINGCDVNSRSQADMTAQSIAEWSSNDGMTRILLDPMNVDLSDDNDPENDDEDMGHGGL